MTDEQEKINLKTIEGLAEVGGWRDAYLDLRAATYELNGKQKRLSWKQAAFAAWDNAPKKNRRPKTMVELATLLNYASEQVFYKWRKQGWYRELAIGLRESILLQYLADVDLKTIAAALGEDGSPGVASRKLFYEQLELGKSQVEVSVNYDDLNSAIERELARMAESGADAIVDAIAGDADAKEL